MATTAQLEARLEALKTMRDTGVLTVQHGDQQISYRTLRELERIIAALEAEIAGTTTRRSLRYLYQSGKGL